MQITLEEWVTQFKPIMEDEITPKLFENLSSLETYPANQIWTEEDDGESNSIYNGVHWSNRMGYYATEIPWTKSITIVLSSKDDEEEE